MRATATRAAPPGIEIDVESAWGAGTLATRLVGDFNADNALAVLAVLLTRDIPLAAALRALGESNPRECVASCGPRMASSPSTWTDTMTTTALRIAQALAERGARHAFGMPGGERRI